MRRWKRLFHRGEIDDHVDWEIRHHLAERVDDLIARGMSPEDAEREARRAFGDVHRVRSEMRAESRGRERRVRVRLGLRGLTQDVRQAARRLRMRPGYAIVATLVLALGIGANTAVYTVLEAALLQRPPYPEPERLVMVDLLSNADPAAAAAGNAAPMPWSYPKFDHVRGEFRTLQTVAGYWPSTLTLTGAGDARRIGVEFISAGYFELLGVRPVRGRLLDEAEDGVSGAPVVLLAERFWRSSFGGDPGILGRTLTLDGESFEVIGVIPERFRGLSGSADVWMPFAALTTLRGPRRLQLPAAHWIRVIGRLGPGVTLAAARADAAVADRSLRAAFPLRGDWEPRGIGLEPLLEARINPVTRLVVAVVSLGAALLLLIACANVAGLLLVRASARRTELAVRAALGAGRARLARESLVEVALLALGGASLGAALAVFGQRWIASAARYALDTSGSRELQFLDPAALTVDGSVLAVGLVAAIATTLAFGLLPALAASRPNIAAGLHGGGRGALGSAREATGMARGALVAGQLALTLVLLCGAGLMGVSLAHLSSISIGFSHRDVLTVRFSRGAHSSPEEDLRFDAALLERVRAMPGVRSAAIGMCPPLTRACEITDVNRIDGVPLPGEAENTSVVTYPVSDEYFRTLGIAVRRGTTFDARHAFGAPPVAVISESAAERFFPGESAIGRRVSLTHWVTGDRPAEIIGVVADVQHGDLEAPLVPTVYLTRRQAPVAYGSLMVRADGDPYALVGALRREFASLAPDVPLMEITTLEDLHRAATARTRVVLWLLAAFAVLGLVLSATGLYGVVSYAVLRRTREMGVRIALGATAGDILRLVTMTPASVVAAGATAGAVAAVVLAGYVRELLFGVSAADPLVLGSAVGILLGVALVAAYVPARRSLRVDPASALRAE